VRTRLLRQGLNLSRSSLGFAEVELPQIALECSLVGTDDSEHYVGDDEHDYDDGGVLDESSGALV
jgi:hypothetical protein